MADSEVLKQLKDIPLKIQTASLKGRCDVVKEIQNVLSLPGITEPIVRFVCRVLAITLHRYKDSASQLYIKKLIAYLATNHKEWTLNNLPPVLLEISEQLKATSTSKSVCQNGLSALRWSTVLVECALKEPPANVDYMELVHSQANLLAAVSAYGDAKKNNKAYHLLHNAWCVAGKDCTKEWLTVLMGNLESGPQAPVMFSALCRHFSQIGEGVLIKEYKAKMLESFIKNLITVKARPNASFIKATADLLRLLEKSDIQDTLLPALQKAMLRSPETIIEAVGEVMNTLDIELDGVVVDIGKSLIGNLHSKDEWVRLASNAALTSLCARVASLAHAQALLTHCVQLYGGLTSSEDKIAVIAGMGTLHHLAVSASDRPKLTSIAVTTLGKVLESETHVVTLCAILEALATWPAADVTPLVKKNLTAKTPQQVRIAYLILMSRCLRHGPPANRKEVIDIAAGCLDKALPQILQPLAVSECLCALTCLAQLEGEALKNRTAAWSALTHPTKCTLIHDRALAAAADDVLIQVVWLCRNILEHHPSVASDKNFPVYRALILTLLSVTKSVRTAAVENVKELLAKQDKAQMSRNLVLKLVEVLEEGKILGNKEKTDDKGGEVTGKIITDCVHAICSYREYPQEEIQHLAIDTLRPLHHPLVYDENRRAWLKLACYLKLDPKTIVGLYANNLKNEFICGFKPDQTISNVVSTLVSTNAGNIAECAVQCALEALRDESLTKITRDEYFTYLTPDGELFDKSVLPNEDNKEMNLKRESKAYSYKEQLEEQQLKRELEEKRRREGKVKEVPLTAKQKEAIKAQEAKENAIRARLTVLNDRVEVGVSLIRCLATGSKLALYKHARTIIPATLCALRSPLSAERAANLYVELREYLLERKGCLPASVAYTAIRLHKPQCDIEECWLAEPLEAATSRNIALVHAAANGEGLTAPAFCYVFPLLKEGLTSSFAKSRESMLLNGVQVITKAAEHALCSDDDAALQYNDPKLLPLEHVFTLLIDLISSTSGRVQTTCTAALLATAQCGADFTSDEINCLLSGLQNPSEVVRDACLRALLCVQPVLASLADDPQYALHVTKWLLVTKFDVSEDNAQLAKQLWDDLPQAETTCESEQLLQEVVLLIQHPAECIQRAAAAAIAHLADNQHKDKANDLPETFTNIYVEALPMIPARLDQFGHVVSEAIDAWGPRRGVATALAALAPLLTHKDRGGKDDDGAVSRVMKFLVTQGLPDRSDVVRAEMLNAAMKIVDLHGKETIGSQLPVFEEFLDKAPKSGNYDAVRQCVVLLVGSLARHLEPHDARIKPIALRLVQALSTPSQQVQEAVSNCLPHLVTSPALKDELPAIVNKLMKQLLTAEKYGDRKGAAYGIAGIVKGLGILALKQLDIMSKLTDAIQEKKSFRYREGALFAFEMLCLKLGRLFEPYIVHVLPHLLLCFGDTSQYVRAAADETAKLIMSKLSAHGVKLVLPSLLAALEDDNWRTKAGSVELLGAMAYCAPRQLSGCLPSIVPRLIAVLGDSSTRVQAAGAEALKVIGSVIRNPEIQAIVPVLLQALQDPSNKTSVCLQTLLDTKFVHFIDAPSLALIMPVVERAFQDRSTETRKMAAQIIGNMYSLTDQKDLMPYLPSIIPGLKTSLLDPVPEVRSVSARALGAMVRGMGESSFDSLLPWLMSTLTSEHSSVDRSGAAQGLAELVAGLGKDKLHKLMPDIIATAERTDIAPHVKDGYIMMFIYMPGAFTDEFLPYIGQIINPILKALADENEYVRETALKAGQRIVNLYADSAITLLLPELENGLFDDNWRIRYSSVQLLGDLLYRISGVSGKMSTETASEDDNFGTEQSHKAIIRALGVERRNRVLAGLYMGRSDVALMVRQAALHVWKVVVTNTPKTLREILPTLFGLLLGCLASTSYDKRQVAARTLGDLVRKLGERVLVEIVPILERGLTSDRADQRQGVCIGLGEIIASTSRDSILAFADGLVPTVRTALCDPLPEVRMAAARTFDSLHATIGSKALDDILPWMLEGLQDPDPLKAEAALDGLRQVMAIKSRAVLPYLVPQLTAPPVDTKALSALAAAAGDALAKHLHRVLPALLGALAEASHEAKELEHCRQALLPVTDEAGVRCIIDTLLEASRAAGTSNNTSGGAGGAGGVGAGPSDSAKRRAAAALLCAYVSHTRADLAPYVPQLIRGLLVLFAADDQEVVMMSWEALWALTKSLEAERQIAHVGDVRQALRYVANDLKGDVLPGFCLPKGIAPILPLFRESILNGLPEDKEAAALMLAEVLRLTSPQSIQPSVVHITGPLIRILGDRFSANVKAAVLETLALLLSKVGPSLKQFLPQLQTTFLKSLSDPNRTVRMKAGLAVSQLVKVHARADPFFLELHNGIKNSDDPAIRETMLQALRSIITGGGDKMTDTLAVSLLTTLTGASLLGHQDDPPRSAVGGCLGALIHCLPPPHRDAALQHHVLNPGTNNNENDWLIQHGRSCALFVALKETPSVVYKEGFEEKIEKALLSYLQSDKVPIVCNGIRGIGYLIKYLIDSERNVPQNLLTQFVRSMNHTSNEVKQLMACASTMLGRSCSLDAANAHELIRTLIPALVNGTKEKNTYVRANSEIALRAVLRMPQDEHFHLKCMSLLEAGGREALADVVGRVLRRAPDTQARHEELDCTLIA